MKKGKFRLPRKFENQIKFFNEYFYSIKYQNYKNEMKEPGYPLSALDHYRCFGFDRNYIPNFFHDAFYCHRYVDAALEISKGIYTDAFHHYTDIGHSLGYLPRHPDAWNIATGKSATQSSVADEFAGELASVNAARALDGNPLTYFSTREEPQPWWQIDLGEIFEIYRVVIFNRQGDLEIKSRAWPINIYVSDDGANWKIVYWSMQNHSYGHENGTQFEWYCWHPLATRFIRIASKKVTALHFCNVEVFGEILGQGIP